MILTTEANESMRHIHHRMPLILEPEQITDWLRDEKAAEKMLRQIPIELKRKADYEQMTLFPM